ncbi:methyltransferase [Marinobacter adhaerens]|uniref:Methyltransferase n=1 Tax=Marinobacter adhaerens TaxID=1033846 RepID=A0A851HKP3_9GAMM|nr:methyltransferase [Marinobacter adhaerens]
MSVRQSAEDFYSTWQALNDWLVQHQAVWQPAPFTEPRPAWARHYPELADWLKGLTNADCAELDADPVMLSEIASRYVPELALYPQMVSVSGQPPGAAEMMAATLPEVRATDMPGRKREQAGAFVAALKPLQQSMLDWCCGKGHLSRTLAAQSHNNVVGYEKNPELVADGNRLARRYQDAVQIHAQDVMANHLVLPGDSHALALHACGDLHRHLLKQGAAAALPRLSVSPCCYHKTFAGPYQTLSQRTGAYPNRLVPERQDLRLAVRETVTAPSRARVQNRVLSQWRLGFDGLQRDLRGVDEYLPVPSYPPRLLGEGFPAFCHWAADKKHLGLPAVSDFNYWLSYGRQRYDEVRRYELLRHLFRRPLELWVVLDYAVFLEEQGYQVQLSQFCARSLTPRNLLLDAVKKKGA